MSIDEVRLTPPEKQATIQVSLIMGVRMLGLFMVLPIMALGAQTLQGVTPQRLGVAIGIYGLFQAVCQIPLGLLSDRVGRKPIIYGGLALLVVGSLIAATADHIVTLIVGRALQGAGAIGATLMASLSDMSRPIVRTRAMAIMGASIGVSFVIAFIIGPMIYQWAGLSGVFYATAGLAIFALGLAYRLPAAAAGQAYWMGWRAVLTKVVQDQQLWRLFISVMLLHAFMSASFVLVPQKLSQLTTKPAAWVYGGALVIALGVIMPLFRRVDRQANKGLFIASILGVVISGLLMLSLKAFWGFTVALTTFFSAFCLLEAWLPAMTANRANEAHRGATLGVFSTFQFLGIFVGGTMGGLMLAEAGVVGLQGGCLVMGLIWLLSVLNLRFPDK